MKTYRVLSMFVLIALVVAALAGSTVSVFAQEEGGGVTPDAEFVPGEVVVGFQSGQTAKQYSAQASALAGTVSAQVVGQYGNLALLSFAEDSDVAALSEQISALSGVSYAEPNYIFRIPEQEVTAGVRPDEVTSVSRSTGEGKQDLTLSVEALKSMRTVRNGRIMATYPNDPYLWENWGWSYIEADIVSPNVTASAGVCELDTGVDYLHKDLTTNIIKGYDFVNNDADPMDDNGHGTHVAGVMAAIKNNKEGIGGVSTGKVVAVKVLNAQGSGTNFHVATGIYYCANRVDIKVLSMSLGGGLSSAVYWAVDYAVNSKGKLLVAAAGNSNTDVKSYPGGFSDYSIFWNKVLSVGAIADSAGCRASYSNYGSWVSVVAPGSSIYSTLPWDKPFYMNYYEGFNPRYDYLSGTSMATPFVSAAAARRWGYKPLDSNVFIGSAVKGYGYSINADGTCWPTSMSGVTELNVASLLDRGALYGYVYNATTGLPLVGAQFMTYQGTLLRDTGLVSSFMSGYAESINLPVGSGYSTKVNLAGVTTGPQPAFWHQNYFSGGTVYSGWWTWTGRASIPNKSGNFDVVSGWYSGLDDLDLDVWLPDTPNPLDYGQPAPFIVGPEGSAFGYLENDPTGSLGAFPFAMYNREGGYYADGMPMESITIFKRMAHSPLAANAALPYYPGDYWLGVTDWGQVSGVDTLLYTSEPFIYIWKDGIIKSAAYNHGCNSHWWFPFRIYSGTAGVPSIVWEDLCTDANPYVNPHIPGFTSSGVKGEGSYFIKK